MSLAPHVDSLPLASKGELPGRGRLQGQRVLVVGGGQRVFDAATDPIGNGRAMSILYSREGADVVVVDANLDSAQVTVDAIRAEGGTATALQADVSDPEAVPGMIASAVAALGGLDALVYNVGIGIGDLDFAGVDLESWNRTFDVNVRGAMLTIREALPVMSEGGSMVLISTTAAVRSSSRLVAYEVSKSALMGLMRHAAREASARGIRVNMVFPGLVDTPNGRTAGAGRPDRAASNVPLGRMATGWDIAYGTLFFMGDESTHVTAQTLAVDGGRTGI